LPDHKIHKAVAVLSGIAGDALGELGKLRTFGLAHVEDIGGAEADQNGLILRADVLLGLFILFPAYANNGGQNADAVLALLDLSAKLVPRVESSNTGCVRLLRSTHTLPMFR
jgi:hypothetical protein